MNWDAVSAIAELAGAVAVVASLIYVARQVRANTSSVRTAAYGHFFAGVVQLQSATLTDAELMSLMNRVHRGAGTADFSEEERMRIGSAIMAWMTVWQHGYLQASRQAVVERDVINTPFITALVRSAYFREFWGRWRMDAQSDFRDFVESGFPELMADAEK